MSDKDQSRIHADKIGFIFQNFNLIRYTATIRVKIGHRDSLQYCNKYN